MSIVWNNVSDIQPTEQMMRILALDRRTGFIAVVTRDDPDDKWMIVKGVIGAQFTAFTHWAPITLPNQ